MKCFIKLNGFSCRSNITWRECADRGTRSTGTRHGGAILVTEAAVTVVVVDIDLLSVDLSFFDSLAYGPCRVRENDTPGSWNAKSLEICAFMVDRAYGPVP